MIDMDLPSEPVSSYYGYDRGTPVDRYYIERFLTVHAERIRGDVAEIKDSTYATRFGGTQVTSVTVIDVDCDNPNADLVVDLTEPSSLPECQFDCIILTQTIQFLARPRQALVNCWQALTPGGTLLLTAPTVGRLSLSNPQHDYWRLTPSGLANILKQSWVGETDVVAHGNLRVCVAMLVGYASEELHPDAFTLDDPAYPLVVCARAQRTSGRSSIGRTLSSATQALDLMRVGRVGR